MHLLKNFTIDLMIKEVEEGLHITSMAGTWMSIVEGFGGMRIVDNQLHFNTRIPDNWESYTFKVNFRDQIIKVTVSHKGADFELTGTTSITLFNHGGIIQFGTPNQMFMRNQSIFFGAYLV